MRAGWCRTGAASKSNGCQEVNIQTEHATFGRGGTGCWGDLVSKLSSAFPASNLSTVAVFSSHASLVPPASPQARDLLELFVQNKSDESDFKELLDLGTSCGLDELLQSIQEQYGCILTLCILHLFSVIALGLGKTVWWFPFTV